MLLLEGGQGVGKSSGLRILGGDHHSADSPDIAQSKEFKHWLQGVWIAELAELDAMRRAEATAVKSALTETTDRFRLPYGCMMERRPRRAVFAGTTNETNYLKDATGNRRFLPVYCQEKVDLVALKRDRDQLWGEAAVRFTRGERWYPSSAEEELLAEKEQNQRLETDELTEAIVAKAHGLVEDGEEPSMERLLREVRGLDSGAPPQHLRQRIGRALRADGWHYVQKRTGRARSKVYVPPVR